ncbi:MAG: response regulator [Nitrospinae bacterium]|nr:response regulator [Nitrospinota bacterium]
MNILIVDDQKFFLTMYEGLLREANPSCNIISAETGRDAVSKFHSGIDIVILDYQLPDMDGISVMKEMLSKCTDMPIIMVTGEGSEEIAAAAIKNGAYDYVVKTNEYIKTLPFVVEHCFERKRLIEEKKKMEEQKIEIERLRVLKEVAAALSHEINNPLTSIVMTVHLLQKRYEKDENIMSKLRLLMENARRIEEKIAKLSNAVAVVSTDYPGGSKIIDIEKSAK